ncbi:AroM family protein [Sporanaerobacter acetigenes]|nr:AroM family protein [Sporanaerobacter acetigenes]
MVKLLIGDEYMERVATITIGQSPRVDLVPEILKLMRDDIEIVEYGILDSYTYEEAENMLRPNKGDNVLVSRMRDGRQIEMKEELVPNLIQECINNIEKEGINTIFLLCTGKFPEFEHKGLLLEPFSLLHSIVKDVSSGKIGVIVPDSSQIDQTIEYWREGGNDIFVRAVSPYKDFFDNIEKEALDFKNEELSLIVLDCMGYSLEMKKKVKEITGKPVLLPRIVMSKLLEELV